MAEATGQRWPSGALVLEEIVAPEQERRDLALDALCHALLGPPGPASGPRASPETSRPVWPSLTQRLATERVTRTREVYLAY